MRHACILLAAGLAACVGVDPTVDHVEVGATATPGDAALAPSRPIDVGPGGVDVCPEPPAPGVQILVSDEWYDTPMPATVGDSYVLDDVEDLVFYLYLTDVPDGVHLLWLEYAAPGGATYQKSPLALAIGDTQVTFVTVDGLFAPAQVWPTMRTPIGFRATTVLAVGGTDIADYELTGAWTVRVIADAAAEPIATAVFTLE